jgi:hypothetical protein
LCCGAQADAAGLLATTLLYRGCVGVQPSEVAMKDLQSLQFVRIYIILLELLDSW